MTAYDRVYRAVYDRLYTECLAAGCRAEPIADAAAREAAEAQEREDRRSLRHAMGDYRDQLVQAS